MQKEKVFSLKNALTTPRKAGIVLDLFKGKSVEDAYVSLQFSDKKASKIWLKLIKSGTGFFDGISDADIKVKEAYVGPGTTLKRHRFKARGRVSQVLKRKSNLYVKLAAEVSEPKPAKAAVKAKTAAPKKVNKKATK